ncbi:MAG: right-handed parallel beta-helix repeat-containing protein [Thermoguttaceae bacterium]|nr:right-handed parallel beta-helix repeat-containing protein [Thermoguttaceae bacterium]
MRWKLGTALAAAFVAFSTANVNAETTRETAAPERVVASAFGFDATDSTAFLQAAIDSGARTVVVDKQDGPWVTTPLTLRSDLELVLEEGVEIVAKAGEFRAKGDVLMSAPNVENLTIRGEGAGATLRMRKTEYWEAPYEKSEWRHGLSIRSAKSVKIENLRIAETGGDGIYLGVATRGVPCRDVVIRRVECVANNRQGISVISVDGLLIEDCVLRDTFGTAPQSGIDFEPNSEDEQISNVVMRRVTSENNAGDGFQFYLGNLDSDGPETTVEMVDCRAVRNRGCGFYWSAKAGPNRALPGRTLVENCDFLGNGRGILAIDKTTACGPFVFRNVRLTTPSADAETPSENANFQIDKTSSSAAGITLRSRAEGIEPLGGVAFENVEIVDAGTDEPRLFSIYDGSGDGCGVAEINGALRIRRGGETVETDFSPENFARLFPELAFRRVAPFDLKRLNGDEATTAEIVDAWRSKAASKEEKRSELRVRNDGDGYFYAEKGDDVSFAVRLRRVGRYELEAPKVALATPSGKTSTLTGEASEDDVLTRFTVRVEESGWQTLTVAVGANAFRWEAESTPILSAARPAVNLIGTAGDFWVYVPKNAPDFGVRVSGDGAERVSASLFDPSGAEVWRSENIDGIATWTLPVDEKTGRPVAPPQAGFWRLRFEKPTVGVLEDFHLTIQGVPALVR